MESQHAVPAKTHGFIQTFLIAVLACIVVLALVIGGFIAYFVYANPTTVTSQQETCAVSKLGQARVNEIKAGASITASDIAAAGSCF